MKNLSHRHHWKPLMPFELKILTLKSINYNYFVQYCIARIADMKTYRTFDSTNENNYESIIEYYPGRLFIGHWRGSLPIIGHSGYDHRV